MIGRSQPWKRCRPPSLRINSWPGVRNRWNVFPSTMSNPSSPASRTSSVLTTALVASGTKAGVRTSPCASFSVPVRARESGARVWICRQDKEGGEPRRPSARAGSGRAALDGGGLGAADRDAPRLALVRLGDAHLEHPAVEAGGHGVGVDALGQGERAGERARRALDAVEALALLLVLGLALARDRERGVLELDRDVLLGHAG